MDAGAQVAQPQQAKLEHWMTQSYPLYAALIEDIRSVAGADIFARLVNSATAMAEFCRGAPGEVCWALNKLVDDPYERREIARRVAARAQAPSELAADLERAAAFRQTGIADFHILTTAEVAETAAFLD